MLARCSHFLDSQGNRVVLSEEKRTELKGIVTMLAQQGLRTLCLTYRDFGSGTDPSSPAFDVPPEDDLTATCIVGIKVKLSPASSARADCETSCIILWTSGRCGADQE